MTSLRQHIIIFIFANIFCLALLSSAYAQFLPAQPPFEIPLDYYKHSEYAHWKKGILHEQYHVFEPAKPIPEEAGLIIFLHDARHSSPTEYLSWIEHLAKRGWVVVFPRYEGMSQKDSLWLFNAIRSIKEYQQVAFDIPKPKINYDKFAIVGHGTGAVLAANMAATVRYFGLPDVGALFINFPQKGTLKIQNLLGIEPNTKMIVMTGDRSSIENEKLAKDIYYLASRVKFENKIHLTVLSDLHGFPPVVANQSASFAHKEKEFTRAIIKHKRDYHEIDKSPFYAASLKAKSEDVLIWYANYRIFDNLLSSAFEDVAAFDVLSDNYELRSMGYWSDKRPIKGILPAKRP